jgi:hypothetical protein
MEKKLCHQYTYLFNKLKSPQATHRYCSSDQELISV